MNCQVSISVDVNSLAYYANFAPDGLVTADPILSYTMPKLLDLLAELDIAATFFVIGETVADHRPLWRRAVEAGHEVASHSHRHVQAFHRLSVAQKQAELTRSKETLEDCTGRQVFGFRAPAYNIDLETLELLLACGYRYDSSFFPGWYVPLSKVVTRLISPTYRPVPTSPLYRKYWRLPSEPFRWALAGGQLPELPLPTTRFKKPFLGTVHLSVSARFFKAEVNWLARRKRLIPYELHPIELADEVVLAQSPWLRNVPGVGKHQDPWAYLRFRLQQLKQAGKITLLRDCVSDDTRIVHSRPR